MDARGALPVARAGLSTATTVALAVAGHVAAGGHAPSGAAVVALIAGTVPLLALVSRAPLRLRSLVPLLAGLQVLLHRGLEILPQTYPAGLHVHGAPVQLAATAATMPTSTAMPAAHAAAAALAAVVLVAADRAALASRHWLRHTLPLLLGAPAPAVRRLSPVRVGVGRPSGTVPDPTGSRRGPPAGVCATA